MRHSIIAFTLLFAIATTLIIGFPSSIVNADGQKTLTTFRVVGTDDDWMFFAKATVTISKFETQTAAEVIEEFSLDVTRSSSWEEAVSLDSGCYYEATSTFSNGWQRVYHGRTQRFRAEGETMVVYCAIATDYVMPVMPTEWCVYGDDEQEFKIWAKETLPSVSQSQPSHDPSSYGQTQGITPLPTIDTEVIASPETNKEIIMPVTTESTKNMSPTEEKRASAKIGNFIVLCLLLSIMAGGWFALRIMQARKRQIK